jgi:hypothetical protein
MIRPKQCQVLYTVYLPVHVFYDLHKIVEDLLQSMYSVFMGFVRVEISTAVLIFFNLNCLFSVIFLVTAHCITPTIRY